jgi:ribosomal protein S18 acetylase RimI-like enzyme
MPPPQPSAWAEYARTPWIQLPGTSELTALAVRCLHADGGLPLLANPDFLDARWSAPSSLTFAQPTPGGAQAPRGLVAAGAVRPTPSGASFTGLVDPAARGHGLGTALLDQGLAEANRMAGGGLVIVETETLTDEGHQLFTSRGLHQIFAEDVMRFDLTTPKAEPTAALAGGITSADKIPSGGDVSPTALPTGGGSPGDAAVNGLTLTTWSAATTGRFYAAYHSAFRERHGFPGTPTAEWIADAEDDDDFRPGWSLLATLPGTGDAGFLTATTDWIMQVGVVPAARGRGIATILITEALSRMAAGGGTEAWLTVNTNNPGAARLYERLGFRYRGRRARYQQTRQQ